MGFDLSVMKKYFGKGLVVFAVVLIIIGVSQRAEADETIIGSPNWDIYLDDYGYSDDLIDRRSGFEGLGYLSGEWGGAVGYTLGAEPATTPKWLTPNFEGPDWTTNSDFSVISGNVSTGVNGDGFDIFQSTIGNADLQISITSQVLDASTGIAMGSEPASSVGGGTSLTSDRYVFKQSYGITNISGEDITDLKFYQLLVGEMGTDSLYDDRDYGGILGDYRFDTTINGESFDWNRATGEFIRYEHAITMHTDVEPTGYESGDYIEQFGIDDVKPLVGVHLSVEVGVLNGVDEHTVEDPGSNGAGAQEHTLGNLADGATEIHDILLSINAVGGELMPWRPGETAEWPVMPEDENDANDTWLFWFGAPDGELAFFDPEVAIGYDYYHGDPFYLDSDPADPYIPYNPDQNFQSVLLPDFGDGLYELYLFDTTLGDWVFEKILMAGVEHLFGLGGVDRFRILGIEPGAGLDPNDPMAFVTGVRLVTPGTIAVTMQSIVASPVPEPSTYILLGSGIAGLIIWRWRRKG